MLASRALGAFTRDYDAVETVPPLPLWAALLRLARDDEPIPQRQLPERARISRRAAEAATQNARGRGWVSIEPRPDGKRGKAVTFTRAGVAAAATGRAAIESVEAAWASTHDDALPPLRTALERLVAGFPLELPHHPIAYGTADPTITGWHAPVRRPDLPPHGQDWRPVRRDDPGAVTGLPLCALLAAVVVQYTIDYDRAGTGTLYAAVNVLRHHPDLPAIGTARGTSLLERHGIVAATGERTDDGARRIQLTALGMHHLAAFEPQVALVERQWRDRYGPDAVAEVREGLEDLTPRLGRGLPDHIAVGLDSSG